MKLNLDTNKKLQGILSYFGPKNQKEKFIEELRELADALEEAESFDDHHVLEEMADVAIMFNQYVLILKNRDAMQDKEQNSDQLFDYWVRQKIKRTIQRIEENKGGYCEYKNDCDSVVGEEKGDVLKNELND